MILLDSGPSGSRLSAPHVVVPRRFDRTAKRADASASLGKSPQMIELVEGLWVVSGERLTHPWDASAYLITGDEPTLIDCGSSEGYPVLKEALAQLGYRPRDIRTVIATHGHWDHLSEPQEALKSVEMDD